MSLTLWARFTAWLLQSSESASEAFRERREKVVKKSKPTYEVYPDKVHRPRVRIVLISGKFWEPVDTDGFDIHELNWKKAWRRDWLMDRILEAFINVNAKIDAEMERKKQEEP